jgi:hypothetical protein
LYLKGEEEVEEAEDTRRGRSPFLPECDWRNLRVVWEAKCKVGLEDLKVMRAGVPGLPVSNSLASIAGGRF